MENEIKLPDAWNAPISISIANIRAALHALSTAEISLVALLDQPGNPILLYESAALLSMAREALGDMPEYLFRIAVELLEKAERGAQPDRFSP